MCQGAWKEFQTQKRLQIPSLHRGAEVERQNKLPQAAIEKTVSKGQCPEGISDAEAAANSFLTSGR